MSKLGRMRWRVTIEREQITPDNSGGGSVSWTPIVTVWADVRPVRSRESAEGGKREAFNKFKVRIRHRTDITESDRLRIGARVMNIEGIYDSDEQIPKWTMIDAVQGGAE